MAHAYENTVPSEKQVNSHIVSSTNNGRPRILFVGNSITLHAENAALGWHGNWGMAASCREKDYVHQTMRRVCEKVPDASFMIVQAADWEREYWKSVDEFDFLRAAAAYDADIIVIRLGENVQPKELKAHDLTDGFGRLLDFLDPNREKKPIVTNEFWANAAKDRCIEDACRRRGIETTDISHLGRQDEMMAIGLFEHRGVAIHPGDEGMRCIAEILFEKMKKILEGE